MANKYKGEVPIVAGEQTYIMRFTTNSLVELEDAMGMGINAIAAQLADTKTMRVKSLRLVVWASLLDRQSGITVEEAGEVITSAGLKPVMEAVAKAFELTFDKEGSDAPADPIQPGSNAPEHHKNGTGSLS